MPPILKTERGRDTQRGREGERERHDVSREREREREIVDSKLGMACVQSRACCRLVSVAGYQSCISCSSRHGTCTTHNYIVHGPGFEVTLAV